MKRSAAFGLVWLVCSNPALACDGLSSNLDLLGLESRAPIAGGARGSMISVSQREMRAGRPWIRMRRGIEYSVPVGTPVVAIESGRVTSAVAYAGHGNAIIIDHGAGVRTLYARLDSFDVREGDCVTRGSVIGRVGAAGREGNPIIHFEVSDDGQFIWPNVPQRWPSDLKR